MVGSDTFGIVTDPTDPDNLCYSNVPSHNEPTWLYLRHPATYQPGTTYSVECDVMITTNGTKPVVGSSFMGEILCHVPYADASGARKDHVVARTGKLSANGTWTHWTFTFTIPTDSTVRTYDQFSIYSDPVNEKGVGYCIDNLFVRENRPNVSDSDIDVNTIF